MSPVPRPCSRKISEVPLGPLEEIPQTSARWLFIQPCRISHRCGAEEASCRFQRIPQRAARWLFMTPTCGKARCGCAYYTDELIFVYSRVMLEPVCMIEPPSCITLYQFGLTYGLTFQEHAFGGLQPWLRPTVTISRSNESWTAKASQRK
jgi:hypothetical protein